MSLGPQGMHTSIVINTLSLSHSDHGVLVLGNKQEKRGNRHEAVLTNIVDLQDLEGPREINIWACL